MANEKEIEAIISGKVQAVNFRNFAKQKAETLWLAGTVENAPNFKVRVVAQGPEEKLERLVEHLRKGPFNAKVLNVDVLWREPSEEMRGFKIIY